MSWITSFTHFSLILALNYHSKHLKAVITKKWLESKLYNMTTELLWKVVFFIPCPNYRFHLNFWLPLLIRPLQLETGEYPIITSPSGKTKMLLKLQTHRHITKPVTKVSPYVFFKINSKWNDTLEALVNVTE